MPLSKIFLPEVVAAIDLGSNSFHMIVARLDQGELKVVDRLREPVRLGNGLDGHGHLSPQARQVALECLQRFGQRLVDMPAGSVRTVGTNTLRNTKNSKEFLAEAERALGHPIDIISGVEEARLIYLGVSQSLACDSDLRFVMDIGGGSTELIVGKGVTPQWLESLELGCVSMTRRFFGDGEITLANVRAASVYVLTELAPVAWGLRKLGWQQVVGASGTIKAAANVVREMGLSDEGITLQALDEVISQLIDCGHVDNVVLPGLGKDRAPIFIGGLIILRATLTALNIASMEASDGALREGLLYDLVGRFHNADVRDRSVTNLATRYRADKEHADRVEQTVVHCSEQVGEAWGLTEMDAQWLRWAAQLHEIGIAIAHHRHHCHAAYIVAHADLPGFSQNEQLLLASMVRAHRRKFPSKTIKELPKRLIKTAKKKAVLLRLAVILHRGRSQKPLPEIIFQPGHKALHLEFPPQWLEQQPLTRADLEQEAVWLLNANFKLTFS